MKEIGEKDLEKAAGGITEGERRLDGTTLHSSMYNCDKFESAKGFSPFGCCQFCAHGTLKSRYDGTYVCDLGVE